MSRDPDLTPPADAGGEPTQTSVPKSAAAAAARRARRIAGPARPPVVSAGPADRAAETVELTQSQSEPVPAPTAQPVIPAEPLAPAVPAPATEPAPLAGRPPADGAVARWLPAGVLIVAALTMGVLLLTFSHSVWWAKPSSAAAAPGPHGASGPPVAPGDAATNKLREQVLAAAKACVVATNKYDYTTLGTDEAAGIRCTTGVQTQRYRTAMDNLIKGPATKLKASQVPQINTAGIESITADGKQWSIVVYGQLAIHNVNTQSRTDPFAAVVRMDYVHGKWLMADVQTLQEPGS